MTRAWGLGLALLVLSGRAAAGATGDPPPASGGDDRKPSWLGVRAVGEVGFGQVTLAPPPPVTGYAYGRHAALAVGLAFEGEGWLWPQVGLGLRIDSGFYMPLVITPLENKYSSIEPQLKWRSVPRLFGPRRLIAASWRAGLGLGVSYVQTDEPCGRYCDRVYAHAYRPSGSAGVGGLLSFGPVAAFAGLGAVLDTSVDWAVSLNLGLGVEL